ncbi:hypothetical protein LIL_11444 [Leptospira interrogans serovar Linhai str. 56609]|uniref:Uncharacterized protein n=1 Tax=Leptospira interrogans str. UI 12621 TaxID=1049937 RepID=A0A0F6HFM7_LEPIR|nr:hypothetical protein LIL_11444 [Leptospira interrogans serovar Linhai str. 56609]EJP16523.1 hypothetical protein LEP1GSC080_0560 [Leptospira interrogans str. FPW2026]EKO27175.1 hypothetical protein LEP1GSC104_2962 [Leptospira interrogans str. UI 12621]EKO86067.1 hypothetical protein LEP1GSC009_2746 [Leptospira interrogans serovar Grippotyphosa str. Andaman]EMN55041.1 hypothetical protein LEP1GSC089_0424 [Leptospira interrogans serovar Autumnalis str. LP101]
MISCHRKTVFGSKANQKLTVDFTKIYKLSQIESNLEFITFLRKILHFSFLEKVYSRVVEK